MAQLRPDGRAQPEPAPTTPDRYVLDTFGPDAYLEWVERYEAGLTAKQLAKRRRDGLRLRP